MAPEDVVEVVGEVEELEEFEEVGGFDTAVVEEPDDGLDECD